MFKKNKSINFVGFNSDKNNARYERRTYTTSQKLKSVKLENGDILESYVSITYVDVYYGSEFANVEWDNTYAFKYEIRHYYDYIKDPVTHMDRYFRPNAVKTSIVHIADSSISFTKNTAGISGMGEAYNLVNGELIRVGGDKQFSKFASKYSAGPVTVYNTDNDYFYDSFVFGTAVSGSIELNCKRGTSTWVMTDTLELFRSL